MMKGLLLSINLIILLFFLAIDVNGNYRYIPRVLEMEDSTLKFSVELNAEYVFKKIHAQGEGASEYIWIKKMYALYPNRSVPENINSRKQSVILAPSFLLAKNRQLFKFGICYFKFNLNNFGKETRNVYIDSISRELTKADRVYVYNSSLIEIPLLFGYKFLNKKIFINAYGGVNLAFMFKESSYKGFLYYYDDKSDPRNGPAPYNLYKEIFIEPQLYTNNKFRFYKINPRAQLEVGYKLSKKIQFSFNYIYDFRPTWQTNKTVEIIRYSKSMAGITLYYYF